MRTRDWNVKWQIVSADWHAKRTSADFNLNGDCTRKVTCVRVNWIYSHRCSLHVVISWQMILSMHEFCAGSIARCIFKWQLDASMTRSRRLLAQWLKGLPTISGLIWRSQETYITRRCRDSCNSFDCYVPIDHLIQLTWINLKLNNNFRIPAEFNFKINQMFVACLKVACLKSEEREELTI